MHSGEQPFDFQVVNAAEHSSPTANQPPAPSFNSDQSFPDPNFLDAPGGWRYPNASDDQPGPSASFSNNQFLDANLVYHGHTGGHPTPATSFSNNRSSDTNSNFYDSDAHTGGQPPAASFANGSPSDPNSFLDGQAGHMSSNHSTLTHATTFDQQTYRNTYGGGSLGVQIPPQGYPVRAPWLQVDHRFSDLLFESAPTAVSDAASASSHYGPGPPLPPYIHGLTPPILSVDGLSSIPAGFDDAPPLRPRELLPPRPKKTREMKFISHPYLPRQKLKGRAAAAEVPSDAAPSMVPSQSETGQFSHLSSSLGPAVYDEENDIHIKILEDAREIYLRSALNKCSLLEEGERRQEVHNALLEATSRCDQASGSAWTLANRGKLYKTLSAPSGSIASTCKKIARAKIQSGYGLRPSIWSDSDESETEHQKRAVKDLIADGLFPPKFIFGKDQDGKWHPFEHEVILDVVLNTVLELGYQPYLAELDSIICTAAVAVYCALKELSEGKIQLVDFAVSDFKPRYTELMDYIRDHITPNAELANRWKEYKTRILRRLLEFCT